MPLTLACPKGFIFENKSRLAHGIKGLIIHITKDDVEYRFSSERKEKIDEEIVKKHL
jgi:c-di-GMP-binding flagellar brake protein YcgR